jgi:hypothetical protein
MLEHNVDGNASEFQSLRVRIPWRLVAIVKTVGGGAWEMPIWCCFPGSLLRQITFVTAFTKRLYAECTGKENTSSRTVGIFFLSRCDITRERDRERKLLVGK